MGNNKSKANYNSIRRLVELVKEFWPWIVGCTVLALIVATVIVKVTKPVYQQELWLMLNDASSASPEADLFDDGNSGSRKIEHFDNEIIFLTSPTMMRKVVDEIGLNTRYFNTGAPFASPDRFSHKLQEYYGNSPFSFDLIFDSLMPESMRPGSVSLKFKDAGGDKYAIRSLKLNGGEAELPAGPCHYGDTVRVEGVSFVLNAKYKAQISDNLNYFCTWVRPEAAASAFVRNISAVYQNEKTKLSNVIIFNFKDVCIERARDILNTLVEVADRDAKAYANLANEKSLAFLNERIESIGAELGAAESNYSSFQRSQALVDISSQAGMVISADQKDQEQLNDVRFQMQIIEMISGYLADQGDGNYSIIPENMGISDMGLTNVIHSYNQLVTERERMVSNSSERNPMVLSLNKQLNGERQGLRATIANLQKVYSAREAEISKRIGTSKSKIANLPTQQVQMQKLGRRLEVVEPIYQMLQQRREEVQIAMFSVPDKYRVIEAAFGSSSPVSPDKMKIYLVALFLGLVIVPLYQSVAAMARTKVVDKKDITNRVDLPVIAVLAKKRGNMGELLPLEGRDTSIESFRMLRTNLQYLPGAKVLQVTSSIPGEGKSFVASNLALSLAGLDKKVLLIGMDIRKPALGHIFGVGHTQVKETLVSYLLGKVSDPDALVYRSEINGNLDIVFAGPVPPNPLELLAQCDLGKLINRFKEEYDYVLIDSSPFFPVSDASLINPYVDATLYVVRSKYTPLYLLDELQEAVDDKAGALKNVNIVLNAFSSGNPRYGYGYGYYGYGPKEEKKWYNRLFKVRKEHRSI